MQFAHEVLRSIRQIVRRISEHSKQLSRDIGLTVPQLMCLKAIGESEERNDEITVAKVGEEVQLSPATVSRIIDRLARAGLVSRERRARDRRRVCLSLTPAGLDRYQNLPIPLQEDFIQRLLDLPDDERAGLLNALRRIAELMEAHDFDAAPILTPESDVKEAPLGEK
jgi:DNA-binding MarR family transcriptional regulator